MPKQKSKFRILRNPFKIKSKNADKNHYQTLKKKSNPDMHTSPSQKNRRLLGSIVLGRRKTSLEKYHDAKNSSENNKENNGSTDQESSSPEFDLEEQSLKLNMKSAVFTTKVALTSNRATERSKELRKIPMTCSDLQYLLNRENNSADVPPTSVSTASNDLLSPTSAASSSSTSFRGRRGSYTMKYSSLTEKNFIKVPSAKTISDRLYVPSSASSSECASSTGLPLSSGAESCSNTDDNNAADFCRGSRNVNRGGDRAGARKGDFTRKYSVGSALYGRDASLSPETIQIMEEVENAYMSSPIPSGYLSSPPKKSPAIPDISMGRRRDAERGKRHSAKSNVRKMNIDASSLLARVKKSDELKSNHDISLRLCDAPIKNVGRNALTADMISSNRKTNDHIDRTTLSAPIESFEEPHLEWKSPADRYQSSSDERSSTRSPVTIVSEVSSSSSKPAALAVKREKTTKKSKVA
eukprot:CCRYP_009369-RA/>CCRYP_009369-RA protein AED:0.91 eAED:0.88 QI:0/-1/0/1/-1/1/1/0/467